MSLPGVVILGAQKAGTTSVHSALCQRPDVVPAVDPATGAPVKELHFFSDDARWDQGVEWYQSHFPAEGVGIDATPNYLSTPTAHSRIADTLPHCRLLVLLREPAARAYSQYNHYVQDRPASDEYDWALPGESFEANIDAERRGCFADQPFRGFLARGHYADQLESLYAQVPPGSVQVMIFERLVRSPAGELEKLTAGLGLAPMPLELPVLHKRWYPDRELSMPTRHVLARYFQPHNERLRALLDDPIAEWS